MLLITEQSGNLTRGSQSVAARWRNGANWTVRVRYRQLIEDDSTDDVDDDDADWTETFVTSGVTSTIVQGLTPDRPYVVTVDAKNEVGYNTSLAHRHIVISDAETSKSCLLR